MMKPHERWDFANQVMLDLPKDATEDDCIDIGVSLIARGKFMKASKDLATRLQMLQVLNAAEAEVTRAP